MMLHCFECGKNLDESNFYKNVKNKCKNCLNKKLKCQVCSELFTKKWLTNHIEREHQPSESNVDNNNTTILPKKTKQCQQPNAPTYENHAYVIIGPRNVAKTYYMLKVLEKTGNKRPLHIINRSPNEYPNFKTSTEIKPKNKYKVSIVIFDDILAAGKCPQIEKFSIRGRHENLDV